MSDGVFVNGTESAFDPGPSRRQIASHLRA
jgi:hypothetical protein